MTLQLIATKNYPGGRALRYRGGPHPCYVFRGRRGTFLYPGTKYGGGGMKTPYNPRNIRGSDAE